jgi:hypothetical protein
MTLSRQDILDYASRYVTPDAITEFPFDGDLFCLLGRELPEGKILADEEGWMFQGYGVCSGYMPDDETAASGKWLWMHFVSLVTFPPSQQVLKLQPPHVVRGRFQNPERTKEFRILKVQLAAGGEAVRKPLAEPGPENPAKEPRAGTKPARAAPQKNIVRFRKKNSGKA